MTGGNKMLRVSHLPGIVQLNPTFWGWLSLEDESSVNVPLAPHVYSHSPEQMHSVVLNSWGALRVQTLRDLRSGLSNKSENLPMVCPLNESCHHRCLSSPDVDRSLTEEGQLVLWWWVFYFWGMRESFQYEADLTTWWWLTANQTLSHV